MSNVKALLTQRAHGVVHHGAGVKKNKKNSRAIWPRQRLDEWWHCRRVLINTARAEQTSWRRRGQHLATRHLLESHGCNFAALVTQFDKLTRVFKSLLVPTPHLV